MVMDPPPRRSGDGPTRAGTAAAGTAVRPGGHVRDRPAAGGPRDARGASGIARRRWRPGPAGLSRSGLGWGQVRRWPGRSLALWLCLTTTFVLGGALPLVATSTSRTALAETLARSAGLTVEQKVAGPDAFGAFRRVVDGQVRATLGDRLAPGAAYGRLGPLELATVNGHPRPARPGRPRLEATSFAPPSPADGASDAAEQDAAGGDARIAMSGADARRLGLQVGDDLCLAPVAGGATWCARLGGLHGGRGGPEGLTQPARGTAGLTMPLADLFQLARLAPGGTVVAGLTYRLDPAHAAELPPGRLAGEIDRLVAALEAAGRRVPSSPAAALARFEAEQRATSAWLRTLTALVVLEGLVASLGVANRLLDGWRAQAAVLRARGWGWRQVWQVELTTLGWIFAGAVAAALPLDGALSGAAGAIPRPRSDGSPELVGGISVPLVGLAVTLVTASALGALSAPARPLRPRSRPAPGERGRLASAVLGLPGIAVLIPSLLRGSGAAADPWGSLAPVAGALLVGIAMAYPPARLRHSGHDPAAVLARGQVRSRPLQHMGVTLVLMLATATIVLAAPAAAAASIASSRAARAMDVEAAGTCLGATVMAWTGLAVHVRRTGERRRREYAGLAGHGLGEGQVRRSLALERRWTWWCGLGGGSLLGLALEASHLPGAAMPPWSAVGFAVAALCVLAAGAAGGARLADREPARIDPLTAGAISDEA